MADQFARSVAGYAFGAQCMTNLNDGESRGGPGQQHVNRHRRTAIFLESVAKACAKSAECAHVASGLSTHSAGERDLCHPRCKIAQKAMLFLLWCALDNIVLRPESRQHRRNLADRMLQIVVHRKDDSV